MELTTLQKLTKARTCLVLDMPFFGALALRLTLQEDATKATACTDGTRIKYNPAFIDALTLAEVQGVLAHEVMHCALAHHLRRGNREDKRWNSAADYAVNLPLVDSRVTLPKGALVDSRFANMSAEAIYTTLADEGGDSGESGDAPDGGNGMPEGTNGQSGESGGDSEGNGAPSCGEVEDATDEGGNALTPSEAQQAAQDWKIATAQAAQQAKSMGRLPAALDRLVDELVNPLVDWRDALRRFVSMSARNDYRWTPPNRRFVHMGLYLPSCRNEELPPLVVAVDTSGSIDGDTLAQFGAELTAILESYRTTATIIYCDARIHRIDEVTTEDLPLKLKACGGGGTSFAPVFAHIDTLAEVPSCLVYLTDLCGTFPPDAPQYPVLWAKVGNYGDAPPFGEVVKVA